MIEPVNSYKSLNNLHYCHLIKGNIVFMFYTMIVDQCGTALLWIVDSNLFLLADTNRAGRLLADQYLHRDKT